MIKIARFLLILSLLSSSVYSQHNTNGWTPRPTETAKIAAKFEHNRIFIKILASLHKGDESAFNYKSLYEAKKKAGLLSQNEISAGKLDSLDQQQEGSCTSYGMSRAIDVVASINDIDRKELRQQFKFETCPNANYGLIRYENQGSFQGATGSWCAEAISERGCLWTKNYEEFGFDLRNTDYRDAARWRVKFPKEMLAAAGPFKGKVVLLKNTEELKIGLQNGWAGFLCAQASYGNKRDAHGWLKLTGRAWSHCMAVTSYISAEDSPNGKEGYLIHQSWGNDWASGPYYMDQPLGSFYVSSEDMQFHIDQNDSWLFTSFDGFERTILTILEALQFVGHRQDLLSKESKNLYNNPFDYRKLFTEPIIKLN